MMGKGRFIVCIENTIINKLYKTVLCTHNYKPTFATPSITRDCRKLKTLTNTKTASCIFTLSQSLGMPFFKKSPTSSFVLNGKKILLGNQGTHVYANTHFNRNEEGE